MSAWGPSADFVSAAAVEASGVKSTSDTWQTALVSLGSNIGDRVATLNSAVALLSGQPEISSLVPSNWLSTAAVGGPPDQGVFLNGVVRLQTTLSAEPLMQRLLEVERAHGRRRELRWGPRTLDLDLLMLGTECLRTPLVEIPHPRMTLRRFVLEPAVEVAGDLVHPMLGVSLSSIWQHLSTAPPWYCLLAENGYAAEQLLEHALQDNKLLRHATSPEELQRARLQRTPVITLNHLPSPAMPEDWPRVIIRYGNIPASGAGTPDWAGLAIWRGMRLPPVPRLELPLIPEVPWTGSATEREYAETQQRMLLQDLSAALNA